MAKIENAANHLHHFQLVLCWFEFEKRLSINRTSMIDCPYFIIFSPGTFFRRESNESVSRQQFEICFKITGENDRNIASILFA